MRKLVSLLLITLIFAAFTVPAAAVNMSLVIASAPTRYTFEGANLSNSTRTDDINFHTYIIFAFALPVSSFLHCFIYLVNF